MLAHLKISKNCISGEKITNMRSTPFWQCQYFHWNYYSNPSLIDYFWYLFPIWGIGLNHLKHFDFIAPGNIYLICLSATDLVDWASSVGDNGMRQLKNQYSFLILASRGLFVHCLASVSTFLQQIHILTHLKVGTPFAKFSLQLERSNFKCLFAL